MIDFLSEKKYIQYQPANEPISVILRYAEL